MTNPFPLGGLLRFRLLEQAEAAGTLASANAQRRESAAREAAVRRGISDSAASPQTSSALSGIAAARSSMRSMAAELGAVTAEKQRVAEEAQQAYTAAKLQARSLEKLALRHALVASSEENRAEQQVLDELAGTAWQRSATKGQQ